MSRLTMNTPDEGEIRTHEWRQGRGPHAGNNACMARPAIMTSGRSLAALTEERRLQRHYGGNRWGEVWYGACNAIVVSSEKVLKEAEKQGLSYRWACAESQNLRCLFVASRRQGRKFRHPKEQRPEQVPEVWRVQS